MTDELKEPTYPDQEITLVASFNRVEYYLLFPDRFGEIKDKVNKTEFTTLEIRIDRCPEEEELKTIFGEDYQEAKRDLEEAIERFQDAYTFDIHSRVAKKMGLDKYDGMASVVGRFRVKNQPLDTWYLFIVQNGIPVISCMVYAFGGERNPARLDAVDFFEGATQKHLEYFIRCIPALCREEGFKAIAFCSSVDIKEEISFVEALERNNWQRGYYGSLSNIKPKQAELRLHPLYLVVN